MEVGGQGSQTKELSIAVLLCEWEGPWSHSYISSRSPQVPRVHMNVC